MSSTAALAIADRMHMQEAFLSQISLGSLSTCLAVLKNADIVKEKANALQARTDMVETYRMPATRVLEKPFAYSDGIAFIPVHGLLVNRFGYSWSYITGYNFIRAQMLAAEADEEVKGIVFDVNSPGGEAAGCFELSAEIKQLTKPTLAVVDSQAYSGGYALASACDKIIVIPSGGVGSIGVICAHFSYEKYLEDMGVVVTLIYSGSHKADGNQYENLPDKVKVDITNRVDKTRLKFATLVADNRGMDVEAIMATEAQCYRAEDALELGLIDAVATPADAVAVFFNELSGSTTQLEVSMSDNKTQAPGAEGKDANTPANDGQALAAARKAERERMHAILNCEEAKGKSNMATHLATATEMSVEDAKATLAVAALEAKVEAKPTEKEEPKQEKDSAFKQAMDNSDHPKVGVDVDENGNKDNAKGANPILRDYALATGNKLK